MERWCGNRREIGDAVVIGQGEDGPRDRPFGFDRVQYITGEPAVSSA